MPLIALAAALFIVLAAIVLMPLSLVQRYRVGTARRPARGWLATLNLFGIAVSTMIFLMGAAVTSIWVPRSFSYSVIGLAAGCLLGLVGLLLTRWEATPTSLHYTPNRWLVLGITLMVSARIIYGFWRSWHMWQTGLDTTSWLISSGVPGSLAAGAVVLGYYLTYWAGIRRRFAALVRPVRRGR